MIKLVKKNKQKFLGLAKRCLCLFLAILLAAPVSAKMPSDEHLDFFDSNGIYYYNPDGDTGDNCNTTATTLSGDSVTEQMWNFFISKGFNDVQVAGILGNAQQESSFIPTAFSINDGVKYYGLFQWGGSRYDAVRDYITDKGLKTYIDASYNGATGAKRIGKEDLSKLVLAEVEFAYNESSNNWKEKIKKADTPRYATEVFLAEFEIATCSDNSSACTAPKEYHSTRLKSGQKFQHTEKRVAYAEAIYKEYSGKGTTSSGADAATIQGNQISIIGDSIMNDSVTQDAFIAKLPGLEKADFDTQNGRQWSAGHSIVESKASSLKNVVIFELGTNGNITEAQGKATMELLKGHTVFLITNYAHNKPMDGNNKIFNDLAKQYDYVQLIDWASLAKDHPDYIADDGYGAHPNNTGRPHYVNLVSGALNSGISAEGCVTHGTFDQLVLSYAWPEYHAPEYIQRTPGYAAAVKEAQAKGEYVGGSVKGVAGIDCGGFVTRLVRNSGHTPDYNSVRGNARSQKKWVEDHGWLLVNDSPSTKVDASKLQKGDVAFFDDPTHTFIYVGDIPGFNSKIASASYDPGGSYSRAPMAGKENLYTWNRCNRNADGSIKWLNKEKTRCDGRSGIVLWYRNPAFNSNPVK